MPEWFTELTLLDKVLMAGIVWLAGQYIWVTRKQGKSFDRNTEALRSIELQNERMIGALNALQVTIAHAPQPSPVATPANPSVGGYDCVHPLGGANG